METILKYRKKYLYDFLHTANGNFIHSPILLIFMGEENKIFEKAQELIYSRVTNKKAVGIIYESRENISYELKDVINEFIENGFDVNEMRAFIVLSEKTFDCNKLEKIYNLFFEYNTSFLQSIYCICMINERTGKKQEVMETLKYFLEFQKKECVFLIGETKFNNKIINREKLDRDRAEIIAAIAIDICQVKTHKGSYSVGISFFDEYAELIWTKQLKKINKEYSEKMYFYGKDETNIFIDNIDALFSKGYKNNINLSDFEYIICNCTDNYSVLDIKDIEEIIKKMYGEALEVYLLNEEKRMEKILNNQKIEFENAVEKMLALCKGYMPMIEDIMAELKSKEEIFYSKNVLPESGFNILNSEADIKSKIYSKYFLPRITNIKNKYFSDGIKIIQNIIEEKYKEKKENMIKIKEINRDINDLTVNFINRYSNIDINLEQEIDIYENLFPENYVEQMCREINKFMLKNKVLDKIISENISKIIYWLKQEAELYCKNQNWNIEDENYYVISNINGFRNYEYPTNMNIISENYKGAAVIKCCHINIEEYIKLILRS